MSVQLIRGYGMPNETMAGFGGLAGYVEMQPQTGGPKTYGPGDTGPAIGDLQLLLNQIYAQLMPGTPELEVNSVYDTPTAQAVVAMRAYLKLPPSSAVDEQFASALWDLASLLSAYDVNSPPPTFILKGAVLPGQVTGETINLTGKAGPLLAGLAALAAVGLVLAFAGRKPRRAYTPALAGYRRSRRSRRR